MYYMVYVLHKLKHFFLAALNILLEAWAILNVISIIKKMALTSVSNSQYWPSLPQNFTRYYELFACQRNSKSKVQFQIRNFACKVQVYVESLIGTGWDFPVDTSKNKLHLICIYI